MHNEKPPSRQLQTRINLNYRPLSRLSMDLQVMLHSCKGHKFILCIIDEVTNYLITVPIYQSKAEEIGDFDRACCHKILCSRLHNNGSGQCIHVITYELLI